MRLQDFFARSLLRETADSSCRATCGECGRESTLDVAEIVEDGTIATIYKCPECGSPLLRIDILQRNLSIYASGFSVG